uniref:Uncharacterized protein n=1 Tax=Cacopsylla melanoneura TaxID=428564 RepID=A0A8D8X1I4_9HEMI
MCSIVSLETRHPPQLHLISVLHSLIPCRVRRCRCICLGPLPNVVALQSHACRRWRRFCVPKFLAHLRQHFDIRIQSCLHLQCSRAFHRQSHLIRCQHLVGYWQ